MSACQIAGALCRGLAGGRLMGLTWREGDYLLGPVSASMATGILGISEVAGEIVVGVSGPDPNNPQAGEGLLYGLGRVKSR